MAHKQNDDLLMEDDLTAAFLDDEIDAVPATGNSVDGFGHSP